ncbi:MAG: dihydrofolate reductase [Candidatus Peribacteraceae bacterium]|nr:dihydrofolate reductase [Candidatus Peribacteraceae bacterium]
MIVTAVVAVAENGIIGRDGGLPWRLKSEMRRFREVTRGKPLIMGRKTHEAIGRVLPGRLNVVVSRQEDLEIPGAVVAHSLHEALEMAAVGGAAEACLIGGAELYAEAMPLAQRVIFTRVHASPTGDVSLPPLAGEWREIRKEGPIQEEGDEFSYSVFVLERA